MIAVGVVFVPMFFVVFAQVTTHIAPYASLPSLFEELQIIYARVQKHLLPTAWTWLIPSRRWLLRLGVIARSACHTL